MKFGIKQCHIAQKSFPRIPETKEKWIDATGRQGWFPTKTSTICSAHFSETDYVVKNSGNKYMRDGAVPHKNIVTIQSFANAAYIPQRVQSYQQNRRRKRKEEVQMEDDILKLIPKQPKTQESGSNSSLTQPHATPSSSIQHQTDAHIQSQDQDQYDIFAKMIADKVKCIQDIYKRVECMNEISDVLTKYLLNNEAVLPGQSQVLLFVDCNTQRNQETNPLETNPQETNPQEINPPETNPQETNLQETNLPEETNSPEKITKQSVMTYSLEIEKQEPLSPKNGIIKFIKRPKTNAEYCRDYRKKKRANKIKKTAKSSTERVREFRERRKATMNVENDSSNDDFTVQNSASDHNKSLRQNTYSTLTVPTRNASTTSIRKTTTSTVPASTCTVRQTWSQGVDVDESDNKVTSSKDVNHYFDVDVDTRCVICRETFNDGEERAHFQEHHPDLIDSIIKTEKPDSDIETEEQEIIPDISYSAPKNQPKLEIETTRLTTSIAKYKLPDKRKTEDAVGPQNSNGHVDPLLNYIL